MAEEKAATAGATGSAGCSFGSLVALFLSLKTWGWTWWALLHFFCGWAYVAYWVVFYSGWIK